MSASSVESRERRATFRDVLAIREFRALYIAQALSVAGDQLARIAIAIVVFDRTHSTLLTGVSFSVSYLPWLIGGPLLSTYADRLPRRSVMIACDVARALLVALMALPGMPTAALIALVAIVAFGEPPFDSARSALIPDVVGEGHSYAAASTLGNTTAQLAVVCGFGIGGAVIALVGPRVTLLGDAGSFALSALVCVVSVRRRPAAHSDPGSLLDDFREGARTVFRSPQLRSLVLSTWLVLGAAVCSEAAAVPYASAHGHGSTVAGLLTAAFPLGMVCGALILGRLVPLRTSERAMMPLALASPLVLTATAANPAPWVAWLIWFFAGSCAATTITANRIFMVRVPRELRGRAFGIAVTGIAAMQGIYSFLVGTIAKSAGPAHAVADLALPTFAAIAVFALTDRDFRIHPHPSIDPQPPVYREEPPMQAPPRRPEVRAWALTCLVAAVAVGVAPTLASNHAYADIGLPVWWLFLLLIIGQAYPLNFEIRNQPFQVVLETVPLVLGLVFVSPLELIVLRVAGGLIVDLVLDKLSALKALYNAASIALATTAAIAVLRAFSSAGHGLHPSVWPAIFAAVIANELIGGLLIILVLSLTGAGAEFRQTARVVVIGAGVSVIMTFLALFTAASLEYDVATAWAVSVFVFLALAAAQTYHQLVERAGALDRLNNVARELGPIATDPADLAPALVQLRQVIRAASLELAVVNATTENSLTLVTVSANGELDDQVLVEESVVTDESAARLIHGPRTRTGISRLLPTSTVRRRADRLSAPVRTNERRIGVLSAANDAGQKSTFDRSDVGLLQAAADQLAAALEKGRLVESLRRAATLDTLTGLANLESLRTFLDTSLDGSPGGVVILLNIDRFREVNDMLGHDAGDAVLAEVARRLQSSPTQGALIARIGGDQFALAIPGAAGSEVAHLAAIAVKSRVDGPIRLAELSADVRVTIGIARSPDHGHDAATLIRRAEMSMAAAKGGTSGIGEWDPEYERDGSRRLQLLTGLRAGLSDGSLRVEYQPKLRLGTGEVSGFEALVRWSHPELGPISPAEFVPIAEATGLISALTSTVLRQALTACRSWHDMGKPAGVAVNISARSLDDSVLVGQVAAMLTASGLEPRWLTLEITESSLMEDHSRSLEVLEDLRLLGVRLSIDDFGTGYSSLHQLRGLPVHEVKIDRSFVKTVDTDEADRAVVRAVVELCDSLSLVTVAEGVEKAAQACALESLGVQQVQGYFHSRPMAQEAVAEWLSARPTASLAAAS